MSGVTQQPGPNDVLFTQYLRPNGRRQAIWIGRSPEIASLAKQIRALGYHFDAEELMTGHVSFTIEPNQPDENGEDAPITHEIVPNGPAVLAAVDRLVTTAAKLLHLIPTDAVVTASEVPQ